MAQSQPPLLSPPNFVIDQGLEYYAGKSELLDWVNRLLDLNLQRLEQLASGAVYCQILDAFFADVVAIRKVNFLAREEYEILPNYKVLQAAFTVLGFTKELDVAKLSRASTSDLMEFTQWLYKNFKGVSMLPGYNPSLRRQMSLKGPTNSIPLPACVVNGSFEFGRSDLRISGTWSTTTPLELTKTAPRTSLRSTTTTPATGGKLSSGKRNSTPYLNVSSRYKEGLAVPPDYYERRSPRLNPGANGEAFVRRVQLSHGGTQTDFVDAEYRPMTAADVGTEAVSPRMSQRELVQQDSFGCGGGGGGHAMSSVTPSIASGSPHGHLEQEALSFGAKPSTSRAEALSPSTPVPVAAGAATAAAGTAGPEANTPGKLSGAERGGYSTLRPVSSDNRLRGVAATAAEPTTPLLTGPATTSVEPQPAVGPSAARDAEMPTAFVAEVASAAASGTTPRPEPQPATAAGVQAAEPTAVSSPASTNDLGNPRDTISENSGTDGGMDSPSVISAGAAPGATSGTGVQDAVASPASSASVAASPSLQRSAPWRSSGAALPPDIASLLASPAARTRVASAACLRDMATALDVASAALQAVDKSLASYDTLLTSTAAANAPAADGSSASSGADMGAAAAGVSPALCGKARSLQDGLQTLLAHTKLLLSDVQAYSEATTHPQQAAGSPTKTGGSDARGASMAVAAVPKTDAGTDGGAADGSSPRNFAIEAVALLEAAGGHESRLQALMLRASEVLQLPPDGAVAAAAATAGGAPAAVTPAAAAAALRHLTEEQRKLCSTGLLDGHLKAVGIAQFALVQDIHKELAALTSTYFRHTGVTSGGDVSIGGGDGSNGGVGSTGGVSTGSSRKARVFKLGEYQLKQLRNGDIYKGRYVCNKKNGEGVYHFINADVYEGEFRDDRMDGHGVYTFSHEGRYEGQWRNAVYNGTGAETFAKGSTYHGEYAGGLRNGWGVCRFYNGDYYEGQWAKGLRDGSGMQQCTDDSNFVGDYHRGKRHGHGVYSFPNGDRYEGQYSEDLPHGYGTYHFASGQCYQGQWQQGKKHGWSVYTVDNGSRFMGLWSEGKPTWVQPLNADAEAASSASAESSNVLKQAMDARDQAVKAAADARMRAAGHWDVGGLIQTRICAALSQAQGSAAQAQQARRKACDLASRLDSAVALLQTQGGGTPVASATP